MSEERSRFKFRVWDKGEQKMSPVANISFGDDGSALTICIYAAPHNYKQVHLIVEGENGALMQWTGLVDKHGKEIYEGDLVVQQDYPWFDDGVLSYVSTIDWTFAGFEAMPHCVNPKKVGASEGIGEQLENGEDWEVLGNVWEHPHLLEKKEASE